MALYILVFLLILGALCGPHTLLHTFAVAFDMLLQGIGWNTPITVTLSARAGLAARKGNTKAARVICFLFFNRNHCEEAIASDIKRAKEALVVLTAE
jgi:hypothetical protein